MKRVFALTAVFFLLIGLTQIASAGPEPSGKEMKQVAPAPAPECNWTGFYVGALGGYAGGSMVWRDVDFGDSGTEPLADKDQSGWLGGGELGFNYQWRWLVVGLEGTFAYSDVQTHVVTGLGDEPNLFDTRSDWQGTIGGRLGFAWNKFLFFAKGGGAFVQQRYSWLHSESGNVDTFKTDETRAGAMVGGGIEYMINCRWSVKGEYNHYFLGKDNINGTSIDDGIPERESYQTELDQDVVWVGVNYKFWNF